MFSIWFLLSFIIVAIQHKYNQYYWDIAYPPYALLTGIGLAVILKKDLLNTNKLKANLLVICFLLLFIASLLHPVKHVIAFTERLIGMKPWSTYYYEEFAKRDDYPKYYYKSIKEVSLYLKKKITKKTRILIWGYDSIIYFLTGISPCNRSGYIYALVNPEVPLEFRKRYRKEFMQDIRKNPPDIIIVSEFSRNLQRDRWARLELFPKLRSFVYDNYYLTKKIGKFAIFKLIGTKNIN